MGHLILNTYAIKHTSFSDGKELLFKESSPQNIKPQNFHGAMGAHGAHALLGWWTTRRELQVPSGIAPRNRYFKELRVHCREFRNSFNIREGCTRYICNQTWSKIMNHTDAMIGRLCDWGGVYTFLVPLASFGFHLGGLPLGRFGAPWAG